MPQQRRVKGHFVWHAGPMTDPSQFDKDANGWPPPPPPPNYRAPPSYPPQYGYPPQGPGYGANPGYPPQYGYPPPGPGYGAPPGYGFHPVTGEPLSDKSKLVAGLLFSDCSASWVSAGCTWGRRRSVSRNSSGA